MQVYDSAAQEAKVEVKSEPAMEPVANNLLQKIQIGLQLVSIVALVIILLK